MKRNIFYVEIKALQNSAEKTEEALEKFNSERLKKRLTKILCIKIW